MTKYSNCEEESLLEITALDKEMVKFGLSANSSISIRFCYVSGKMVRKIVLNLSNLQTCRPNIKNHSIPGAAAAAANNADSSLWKCS